MHLLKLSFQLLILCLLFSCKGLKESNISRPVDLSDFSDPRTEIKIYFKLDESTFPESWKTERINAKGENLEQDEIPRSVEVILKAMEKYPVDLLKAQIKSIHVLKSIEFFGEKFGGTNSRDKIYIGNDGKAMGFTNEYIEKSFHHEFSSILLRNYPSLLDKDKWMKFDQLEFKENSNGVEALKNLADDQTISDWYNERGFLHQYAISSFENDWNSFAENIFKPAKGFYSAIEKYEGIRNKYEMAIAFYQDFDDQFTKAYFDQFKRKD